MAKRGGSSDDVRDARKESSRMLEKEAHGWVIAMIEVDRMAVVVVEIDCGVVKVRKC